MWTSNWNPLENRNLLTWNDYRFIKQSLRLGTPAMTTRGMKEPEMEIIANFVLRAVEISKRIQAKAGKKLTDFIALLEGD